MTIKIQAIKFKFPHDPLVGFIPGAHRWNDEPVEPVTPPAVTLLSGDDIPEAFRGKPAKEIIDTLLSKSTEAEKLKTDLESARSKEQEVEQLRAEVTRLKTPLPSQLSEEELEAQKESELWKRPFKVLDKHLEEKLKPLVDSIGREKEQLYSRLADNTKESARKKFKDFNKYEKKIDEFVKTVPSEYRAQEKTWETAWRLARSEDLDDREKEILAKAGLHVEGSGGGGEPIEQTKTHLDAEQKRVASMYGMTDEEYTKWSTNYFGD